MRYIFDLDHTLICSKHRSLTLADGSLDLNAWRENCTLDKIFADTLLPLADYARHLIDSGHDVIACTARVMSEHDYAFLRFHGFRFSRILSRPADCTMPDHELKVMLLRDDAAMIGEFFKTYADNAMLFDDNAKVLETLRVFGFSCFNALELNQAA